MPNSVWCLSHAAPIGITDHYHYHYYYQPSSTLNFIHLAVYNNDINDETQRLENELYPEDNYDHENSDKKRNNFIKSKKEKSKKEF
jgi:hypothetical protein